MQNNRYKTLIWLIPIALLLLWLKFWLLIILWVLIGIWWIKKNVSTTIRQWWTKRQPASKRLYEWLWAAAFATALVFAIKASWLDLFRLPSSSMETTIGNGDMVLINKLIMGPRIHANSVDWYYRAPGYSRLQRNDLIVFNFPEGDTLLNQQRTESYYSFKRNYNPKASRKGFRTSYKNVTHRPSYIKRVMGLPGDSLQIADGILKVNGATQHFNEATIRKYIAINSDGDSILNALNVVPYNHYQYKKTTLYEFSIDVINQHSILREYFEPFVLEKNSQDPNIFPHEYAFRYNYDHIGPLLIPQKGMSIELTPHNIAIYARLIDVYEENELEVRDGQIYINGKKCNSYTPKMNYYWVMGDNQPHSYDSRYWGFLPENHIIGVSRWHYHISKKT